VNPPNEYERQQITEENKALRAEVDRLRSALERIESHGVGHAVMIAKDALHDR
jgi:regulator of replication initiation timing